MLDEVTVVPEEAAVVSSPPFAELGIVKADAPNTVILNILMLTCFNIQ